METPEKDKKIYANKFFNIIKEMSLNDYQLKKRAIKFLIFSKEVDFNLLIEKDNPIFNIITTDSKLMMKVFEILKNQNGEKKNLMVI